MDLKNDEFRVQIRGGSEILSGMALSEHEMLLVALARLTERLENLDAHIVLAIHDEIIIEAAQKNAEAAGNALATATEKGFFGIFPKGPVNGLVKLR